MIILPGLLSAEELSTAVAFLADAQFEDGRLTASGAAAAAKSNLQISRSSDPEGVSALDQMIVQALHRHPLFTAYAWPQRLTAPLYARYRPGMNYGAHVDASFMGLAPPIRTDISLTIFLSDPAGYDGGELAIDLGGGAIHQVKLPAGHGFAYPSTAVHLVRPVTRGCREVAVLWAQSHCSDPRQREALFDLRAVLESSTARDPAGTETRLLQKTLSNLERCFAGT